MPPDPRRPTEEVWAGLRTRLEGVAGRATRRPVLVGIDGRSGSGKTDLAASLDERVRTSGRSCTLVHLDDLYRGWTGLSAALRPLCEDVVTPLSGGAAVSSLSAVIASR